MKCKVQKTKNEARAIQDRIKNLEEEIAIGREYLETGNHADWRGFRPFFSQKVKEGKVLPPHKDWIKNVFLPSRERALRKTEKVLENYLMRRYK